MTEEELELDFKFSMQNYSFIALALTKADSNLGKVREDLVPDMLDENEFWKNYFYKVEQIKAENGLPTRLGGKVDWSARRSPNQDGDQPEYEEEDGVKAYMQQDQAQEVELQNMPTDHQEMTP